MKFRPAWTQDEARALLARVKSVIETSRHGRAPRAIMLVLLGLEEQTAIIVQQIHKKPEEDVAATMTLVEMALDGFAVSEWAPEPEPTRR